MMNGFEYTGMDAILAGSFRAAIYCRLSKDDDLDGESASIANQRDMLENYSEKQGWEVVAGIFTVIYGVCLFRMGATETQITRLALGFLIGIIIVAFIILRLLAFINRKRNQNSLNVQEKKETSLSKVEWTKIYNAQNIVETEQLVEMLKQNGIAAFSQEAGANVAMHGAPGFGIYGVDIFVKTDDAEKTVQLIKEINNQENEENF